MIVVSVQNESNYRVFARNEQKTTFKRIFGVTSVACLLPNDGGK